MVSNKKIANAVGGKTARACDSCIRKRARLYCAADDAFLCQACDESVHSANSLARRHERVRLKTSSFKSLDESNSENFVPSWHQGFTRKARTPRHGKPRRKSEESEQNSHSPVPEIGGGETSNEEMEEQLVYRVPIFDPFTVQLCTSTNSNEATTTTASFANVIGNEFLKSEFGNDDRNLHGILPSEMELEEFAADVESLLGKGFDEESFDMESLGLLDCRGKEILVKGERELIKVEEEEEGMDFVRENCRDTEIDLTRETFELNFDYDSPMCEEEETKVVFGGKTEGNCEDGKSGEVNYNYNEKRKLLRLDYDGVITAWADQRSPWASGDRPVVDPNEGWPDCLGSCGISQHYPYGEMGVINGHTGMGGDGGREARVSRYREKRRTRLFSKKIRYEVRKLNAEKRPRMKGRFVKRATATIAPPNSAFPLLKK